LLYMEQNMFLVRLYKTTTIRKESRLSIASYEFIKRNNTNH
jgi:hypothetical protein